MPRSAALVALVNRLFGEAQTDPAALQKCLSTLTAKLEHRELRGEQIAALRPELEIVVEKLLSRAPEDPLHVEAALLAATWKHPAALATARALLTSSDQSPERRRKLWQRWSRPTTNRSKAA